MKRMLLTGAGGGLLWAAAFTIHAAWPLLRWLCGLAGLMLLMSLWTGSRARQRPGAVSAASFAFGLVAFAVACHWIYYSVRIVNGGPVALAAALVVVLAALMACWYALGGYWAARMAPHRSWMAPVVVLPSVLILGEWLRGWAFTGFPWLSAGYLSGPVFAGKWPAILAPAGGTYLIGWLTAILAGACLLALRANMGALRRWGLVAALLGGVAALGWLPFPNDGALFPDASARPGNALFPNASARPDSALFPDNSARPASYLRARLVQGGIPQERKWLREEYEPTLRTYETLSFGQPWEGTPGMRPELIIWPEVAIPSTRESAGEYLADMDRLLRDRDTALALGILTDAGKGRFNSVIVLGNGEGVYHKSHLVPFGEFFPIPDAVRDWLLAMRLPANDLLAGPPKQAPLQAAGTVCAVSICYEAAFGDEQRAWAPAAQVLINVSNDGWFGDTVALEQHLDMARLRAMEAGRYLLRVTGAGITAAVDPAGRIIARLPKHEAGFLDVSVPRLSATTPYVRYGDWPVVTLCLLLGVALPAAIRLRRRRDGAAGKRETPENPE